MKRVIFLILMMSMVMVIQAGEKLCNVCGGSGHVFGHSDIPCSRCKGKGRIPLSASEERREARDRENYANNANDMMEAYNLTPQEYFAFEELMKEAMKKVPIYQNCTACGGTGNCSQCGGAMTISLEDDFYCRVCGGSGICIGCNGAKQIKIGEQDNPQKEQLIQRAKEILNHGQERADNGEDAFGNRNSAGYFPTGSDDSDDGLFNSSQSSREHKTSPFVYVLCVIVGSSVIGAIVLLLFFLFRKKPQR